MYTFVILAYKKLRQDYQKFEISSGYMESPSNSENVS